MKKLNLPVGISDFEKIRENGYYYVDKSGLISELLERETAEVTLMFGCGTAVLGHLCPIYQPEPVVEEVLATEEETDWETEDDTLASTEVVEADAGWQPVVDDLKTR